MNLRRLRDAEMIPALSMKAKRLLALHHTAPYGSESPFEVEGGRYLAHLEEHYHEPGGPMKPWGYHRASPSSSRSGRRPTSPRAPMEGT